MTKIKEPKEKETFAQKVANLLAEKLKFYLTEFGQREDIDEIAKAVDKLAQEEFKK